MVQFPALNFSVKMVFSLTLLLEGDTAELLPAARVKPVCGELHWFVDDAAASLLKKT